MFLNYPVFYRKTGIRRFLELMAPRLFDYNTLVLPRQSIYHHNTELDSLGPSIHDSLLSADHQKIPIAFVDTLVTTEGVQKRRVKVLAKEYHDYVKDNNHRLIYSKTFLNDYEIKAHLGVVSYTPIKQLYAYRTVPLVAYYEWYNLQKTLFTTVNKVAIQTRYHQFIILDVPYLLPSLAKLRHYSTKIDKALLHNFLTHPALNVLDVWRFLDPETRSLSSLSALTPESWKYVNLVMKYENLFYIVNLSQMIGYAEMIDGNKPIIESLHLQKMFLKSLLSMHQAYEASLSNVDDKIIDEANQMDQLANQRGDEPELSTDLAAPQKPQDSQTDAEVNPNTSPLEEAAILDDESDLKASVTEDEVKAALETIDKDLEEIDTVQKMLTEEDAEIEQTEETVYGLDTSEEKFLEIEEKFLRHKPADVKLQETIEQYKAKGILNNTDYKSNLRSLEKFQSMSNPYDPASKVSYNDYIQIRPEDVVITEEEKALTHTPGVTDTRLAESTMTVFDKKYVENVLEKDMLAVSKCIMNSSLIIDSYDIQRNVDAMGAEDIHTIHVKPLIGPASTIHFKVPVVNEDGEMTISGKKYYLRKQRQDLPIRKINDRQVALTSYYGKTFVNKDEKVVNNLSRWLGARIRKDLFEDKSNVVTKAVSADVFTPKYRLPRLYTALAQQFLRIETKVVVFYFDYVQRGTLIDPQALEKLEGGDRVFVGYEKKTKYPFFMDYADNLFVYDGQSFKALPSLYELLDIEPQKVPLEHVTLNVFSKSIPVVITLGYLMGFNNLLSYLKPKHRLVEANKRSYLQDEEYEIKFKDYKLILDRREIKNTLILSGLQKFDKLNKDVLIGQMNDKAIYFDYYKYMTLTSIYLKETDLYNELFIDPITFDVLVEMKEPTTFIGLLLRSVEMLVLDDHPSAVDMDFMRIRGYERIPGLVYKEFVNSTREYRNRSVVGKSQFSMNPFATWRAVNNDAGVNVVSDINPIQNLKQQEGVTFSGTGGRSKDTIVAKDRIFTEADTGVISEATSDSGDAGINTYLTANPALKDLRGLKGAVDIDTASSASLLSTSVATSVAATNDDPKRANFISIQNSHTVGCKGYRQAPVRTGYETVIPQRTKGLFCKTATKKGKVISLNEHGIIVEYVDGEKVGVKLGREYGNHEGSSYPQDVTTTLKLNDTVLPGMAIAYNTNFFEPNFFDPRYLVFKNTLVGKVALLESQYTFEDSCAVSPQLADRLRAETTHIKSVVITFDQNLLKVHPTGTIDYGDILCYVEDSITANTDVFNEENVDTLKSLSSKSVKCKYSGKLDKIEVLYHGDKSDMSQTLRKLADMSDRQMAASQKSSNQPTYTGAVNSDYRVGGNPLLLDTAEVRFYISVDHATGVGDKTVFAHQMKSVIGGVFDKPLVTENGEVVDAIFGAQSIANRIVMSPYIVGTTITLLKKIAKNAVDMYK